MEKCNSWRWNFYRFINTNQIYIYDGNSPSFRWDNDGITAYNYEDGINLNKFVRYDKYGFYGYNGDESFRPVSEADIWNSANFGLTWNGFFLKNSTNDSSFEISTTNDLVIKKENVERVKIGRVEEGNIYGLRLRDGQGSIIFNIDTNGDAQIGGWTINENGLTATSNDETRTLNLREDCTITGTYGQNKQWIIGTNQTGLYIHDSDGIVEIGGTKIGTDTFVTDKNKTIKIVGERWELNQNGLYYNYDVAKRRVFLYHLGSSEALLSNQDLDNIRTPGQYSCGNAVATTLLNSPITVGFKLIVMYTVGSSYIRQVIYPHNSTNSWTRRCVIDNNGEPTWNIWTRHLSTNSLYPVGAVYLSTTNTNPQTYLGGTWTKLQDTLGQNSTVYMWERTA